MPRKSAHSGELQRVAALCVRTPATVPTTTPTTTTLPIPIHSAGRFHRGFFAGGAATRLVGEEGRTGEATTGGAGTIGAGGASGRSSRRRRTLFPAITGRS